MKRYWYLLMLCLLLPVLVACGPADEPGATIPDEQASLTRLCQGMALDESEARALLTLLEELDVTGEVMFAYPAEDEEDRIYYHIWIGEGTADVYLADEGGVAAVRRSGVLLYGELPPSPDGGVGDEAGEAPGEDEDVPVVNTITVEDHTATVVPGGEGYVRAKGLAGVEYKIKVYYSGGVSTAKALSPMTAAEDGSLVWEWKVSSQVKPGVYKIILLRADDERDAVTLPFEVLSSDEQ